VRLVGYVRVPARGQAGRGLDQERVLQSWARDQGHQLVAILRDDPPVGGPAAQRWGLHDALSLIADRRAAGLVVDRVETLAPTMPGQEAVMALISWHGGRLFASQTGLAEIIGDPARRPLREMAGALLRLERGVASARSRRRRRRLLARGRSAGGAPAFGFRSTAGRLAADDTEQAVLSRIAQLRRGGASLRQIARTLDLEGHRPKRSDRWHPETLRRILARLEQDPLAAPDRP